MLLWIIGRRHHWMRTRIDSDDFCNWCYCYCYYLPVVVLVLNDSKGTGRMIAASRGYCRWGERTKRLVWMQERRLLWILPRQWRGTAYVFYLGLWISWGGWWDHRSSVLRTRRIIWRLWRTRWIIWRLRIGCGCSFWTLLEIWAFDWWWCWCWCGLQRPIPDVSFLAKVCLLEIAANFEGSSRLSVSDDASGTVDKICSTVQYGVVCFRSSGLVRRVEQ